MAALTNGTPDDVALAEGVQATISTRPLRTHAEINTLVGFASRLYALRINLEKSARPVLSVVWHLVELLLSHRQARALNADDTPDLYEHIKAVCGVKVRGELVAKLTAPSLVALAATAVAGNEAVRTDVALLTASAADRRAVALASTVATRFLQEYVALSPLDNSSLLQRVVGEPRLPRPVFDDILAATRRFAPSMIGMRCMEGMHLLHLALHEDRPDLICQLLCAGVVYSIDKQGCTPLTYALRKRDTKGVVALLQCPRYLGASMVHVRADRDPILIKRGTPESLTDVLEGVLAEPDACLRDAALRLLVHGCPAIATELGANRRAAQELLMQAVNLAQPASVATLLQAGVNPLLTRNQVRCGTESPLTLAVASFAASARACIAVAGGDADLLQWFAAKPSTGQWELVEKYRVSQRMQLLGVRTLPPGTSRVRMDGLLLCARLLVQNLQGRVDRHKVCAAWPDDDDDDTTITPEELVHLLEQDNVGCRSPTLLRTLAEAPIFGHEELGAEQLRKLVRVLLAAGATPNARNPDTTTSLMAAAVLHNEVVVTELLACPRTDVLALNAYDETALDYAPPKSRLRELIVQECERRGLAPAAAAAAT